LLRDLDATGSGIWKTNLLCRCPSTEEGDLMF
jgi:hypothetical protein